MTATSAHASKTRNGSAGRPPASGLTPALRRGMPVAEGLPRSQSGTTPQRLIMRLLGDYWNALTEPLPSAALVELLSGFDISEPSARAALNRLTKRGLLVASKRGRNTYYGVDPSALPLLMDTFRKTVLFGAGEQRDWDGHWTLVAFSVPESQRQLRHTIRVTSALGGMRSAVRRALLQPMGRPRPACRDVGGSWRRLRNRDAGNRSPRTALPSRSQHGIWTSFVTSTSTSKRSSRRCSMRSTAERSLLRMRS